MIKRPRILIYDDEDMTYMTGYCTSIDMSRDIEKADHSFDGITLDILDRTIFTCEVDNAKQMDNIKLDATTMRRIAKFNKEQEIRRLDAKIKSKKAKIEELDDILEDKQCRVDKIKEFVAHIYDIPLDDYHDEDWW